MLKYQGLCNGCSCADENSTDYKSMCSFCEYRNTEHQVPTFYYNETEIEEGEEI